MPQSLSGCLDEEHKYICPTWWISSINEFSRFYRISNGRQWATSSSRKCICAVNSRSHVQWKSVRLCVTWIYVMCSAVFSLLLEESQHSKLIEIYESTNANDHINGNVVIKLIEWFKMKKQELSSECRSAAFWLKYTQYIQIVQ